MKKLISLFSLSFLVLCGVAFADQQLDQGQSKDTAPKVFFVARYARTTALATSGNMISKDRVVVYDSTSSDGVTINYSTTSNDSLVAGVAMDNIPGSSRDTTAAQDLSYPNWGRIQTWGFYSGVSWDQSTSFGGAALAAGVKVGVSAQNAGAVGMFIQTSSDQVRSAISKDALGILMKAPAAGDKTTDIFINR